MMHHEPSYQPRTVNFSGFGQSVTLGSDLRDRIGKMSQNISRDMSEGNWIASLMAMGLRSENEERRQDVLAVVQDLCQDIYTTYGKTHDVDRRAEFILRMLSQYHSIGKYQEGLEAREQMLRAIEVTADSAFETERKKEQGARYTSLLDYMIVDTLRSEFPQERAVALKLIANGRYNAYNIWHQPQAAGLINEEDGQIIKRAILQHGSEQEVADFMSGYHRDLRHGLLHIDSELRKNQDFVLPQKDDPADYPKSRAVLGTILVGYATSSQPGMKALEPYIVQAAKLSKKVAPDLFDKFNETISSRDVRFTAREPVRERLVSAGIIADTCEPA